MSNVFRLGGSQLKSQSRLWIPYERHSPRHDVRRHLLLHRVITTMGGEAP